MVAINSALNAYKSAAGAAAKPGMEPRPQGGKSFGDLLGEVAQQAKASGVEAEKLSIAGVAGKADVNQVVTAVTNAEVTLQTVVAIRDKVISAYQDILRMPV
ncbi:MAG TPA: flagellar hook-basal body complex protein FliE [Alphaproteobacteria bacterium]|nr:flagellar hook-basal body complex protein FliE [Alphaproteobacteria bacterium]